MNSAIRCTVEQGLGEVLVCAVLVLNESNSVTRLKWRVVLVAQVGVLGGKGNLTGGDIVACCSSAP